MFKQAEGMEELVSLLMGVIRSLHSPLNKKHSLDLSKISPLKIQTLAFIKKRKNPLMKEVADFLAITPSSATSLIEGMAKEKLIVRHLSPSDRRLVHLHMTPKGDGLLKKGFKEMRAHMKEVFTCLTEKEKNQLVVIYKKIYNFNNNHNK
jgi:MarR family 2-MHQ and catechol resistance regulon transcriptional repressor